MTGLFGEVPGLVGYRVGADGSVWSRWGNRAQLTETWHQLTPQNRHQYRVVRLRVDSGQKDFPVHRLVLEAFVGPRPAGAGALHKNGHRGDNRLENLCWAKEGGDVRNEERREALTIPPPPEGARLVPLTGGLFAVVDEADFESVSQFAWHAHRPKKGTCYAHRKRPVTRGGRPKQTTQPMHRFILDAPDGLGVDHVNGDGLDNRRANLRLVTGAQNQANRHRAWGSSRYKGVSYSFDGGRRRWRAGIRANGRTRKIGYFLTEEEAARAYDEAAVLLFGNYACLNFPREGFQVISQEA